MGKAKKEHRAKVAKRNQRISEEKMKMQRAFNKLLKEQMDKFTESEDLNVQVGDNRVEFSVVDPHDVVENVIDVDTIGEVTTVKESITSEDEEQ
jgi:hypothetical protein